MAKSTQTPTRKPASRKATEPAPAPAVEATPAPAPVRRSFRGAGFEDFRTKHDPRWCEKAGKFVHDNEDQLAEELAAQISEFGIWNAPLVKQHLGHLIPFLQSKYAGLNNGMLRMNIGNRLRAALRKQQKQG